MFKNVSILAFSIVVLVSCGAPDSAEPELPKSSKNITGNSPTRAELINRGQGIAEAACASCHAIGSDDVSQHVDAPAFRTIGKQYDVWTLDEAFAEGIMVGHPDMPVWELIPEDIEGLLTYMDSIQIE